MTIKNYRTKIKPVILKRGQSYLRDKRLIDITHDSNGRYTFNVSGSELYTVNLSVAPDGRLSELECSCPYDFGGCCKHIAAALMWLENRFDREISDKSSAHASRLIGAYSRKSAAAADAKAKYSGGIRIVPELSSCCGKLKYTLKIGCGKLYTISNIEDVYNNFLYETCKKYGKDLEFTHSLDILDYRSAKLLELSYGIYRRVHYGYDAKRCFELNGLELRFFFELVKDCGVDYNGKHYNVEFSDPQLSVTVNRTDSGRYSIKPDSEFSFFGTNADCCLILPQTSTIHICGMEFTRNMSELLKAFSSGDVLVSEKDMIEFNRTVINPISRFTKVNGVNLSEKFTPPELTVKLFLDLTDSDMPTARLAFVYGDKEYAPSDSRERRPFRDHYRESGCEALVRKYFSDAPFAEGYRYIIYDEEDIYAFLTEGLPLLSERMEIFATERFKRIAAVRPAAKPALGITPSGGMLELKITAEGYSAEELSELLRSYRIGKKYHRLKNGSFAHLSDSLSKLKELSSALNISDKAISDEAILVPRYRMMYLEKLYGNTDKITINRSDEFKKQTKTYRDMLEKSGEISVSNSLNGTMREYQRHGLRWLRTLCAYGFGGILADDMGLGKTIQAITVMLEEKHGTHLVVCPSTLILNWESELHKFAPSLKVITVMGTAAERKEAIAAIPEYDVAITSYSLMSRDFTCYRDYEFDCHFIDEAQYIKNYSCNLSRAVRTIRSRHRFALTGTPVENTLAELWSIFDFIMPDYLYSYRYFKANYEQPIVKDGDEKARESLRELVAPFILRRMKSDVLTELPEKTETVLLTDPEKEQSKLYSANVSEIKTALLHSEDVGTERIKILAMLTRLRQICCSPALVYDNYTGKSAKLEQCMELIESCIESGHRILLFSQFTSMLDIIAGRLSEMKIGFCMLTGSTKSAQRTRLVSSFNSDSTPVFLLSLKAGGTGLNLTGADVVIHYDPWWNNSAENQASDRAYRIGQTKNVQIYKLITRNTIEEKIRELQLTKSELADIALGGRTDGNIMNMSAEDILSLLG